MVYEWKVCAVYQDATGNYITDVFRRPVREQERGEWEMVAHLKSPALEARVDSTSRFKQILRRLSA